MKGVEPVINLTAVILRGSCLALLPLLGGVVDLIVPLSAVCCSTLVYTRYELTSFILKNIHCSTVDIGIPRQTNCICWDLGKARLVCKRVNMNVVRLYSGSSDTVAT